jgi:hypothetical protein
MNQALVLMHSSQSLIETMSGDASIGLILSGFPPSAILELRFHWNAAVVI